MYLEEQTTQNATFYCSIYFTYDGNMIKNIFYPIWSFSLRMVAFWSILLATPLDYFR